MIWVIVMRLGIGLFIFRYPLFGGIASIIADYFDLQILMAIDPQHIGMYQELDKMLDFYYLSIEAYVAMKWKVRFVKYTALFLYIYRLIGTIIFETYKLEWILVVFPNVFEYFFLIYYVYRKFFTHNIFLNKRVVVGLVLAILVPKIAHEYLLHVNKTHPWTQNVYVKEALHPVITIFANK